MDESLTEIGQKKPEAKDYILHLYLNKKKNTNKKNWIIVLQNMYLGGKQEVIATEVWIVQSLSHVWFFATPWITAPVLCLEGVPNLPGAPQDEAGLMRIFET